MRQEPFPLPQGGESANVIGTPPGFDENRPYVMVGGHRDSLNGPGANDNATGVAVALEVTRAIAVRPAPLQVMFIAFGAEERQPVSGRTSRFGSRYHVEHMTDSERTNLRALVNLDMVGHGDLVCGRLREPASEGTERCVRVAKDEGIPAAESIEGDVSDHGPFVKAGLNAAWLWTGENPCCYHNPQRHDRHRASGRREACRAACPRDRAVLPLMPTLPPS